MKHFGETAVALNKVDGKYSIDQFILNDDYVCDIVMEKESITPEEEKAMIDKIMSSIEGIEFKEVLDIRDFKILVIKNILHDKRHLRRTLRHDGLSHQTSS